MSMADEIYANWANKIKNNWVEELENTIRDIEQNNKDLINLQNIKNVINKIKEFRFTE